MQSAQLQLMQAQCGTLKWPCARDIATKTTTNRNYYYIVWLPDHVICTRNHGGDWAYFFDPNYGEAKCPVATFSTLFATFLGRPDQASLYSLNDGALIHYYAFV